MTAESVSVSSNDVERMERITDAVYKALGHGTDAAELVPSNTPAPEPNIKLLKGA